MISKDITILVADDNPVNLKILQKMLEGQEYRVITASNGKEAREAAKEEIPNLILLDVMMPVEDGITACQKLQQDPLTTDIPVVFISANSNTESKVNGLTAGAWDYITKPFERMEVLARVKNYLKLRHTFLRVIEEQSKRLQQISDAQQAILVNPWDLPKAGFGVNYIPVLEAGGDFYDAFEISKDHFGFFVADISGHDLGASFATSALKALIRQNSSPLYTPAETIRMINSILLSLFHDGQHLTAAYICLDRQEAKITMVNAAHLPVLILSQDNKARWLTANSDVLGIFDSAVFECSSHEIRQGDRIFLFTDGILEIFYGKSRTREEGLSDLLSHAKETRELPIQPALDELTKRMFGKGREPEDDIILLGVDV